MEKDNKSRSDRFFEYCNKIKDSAANSFSDVLTNQRDNINEMFNDTIQKISKNKDKDLDKHELNTIALGFIDKMLVVPGVRINRDDFLKDVFKDNGLNINDIVKNGPNKYFSKEELNDIANKRINKALSESSAIAFVTGLPGGVVAIPGIAADVIQFYAYSIRLAQEISYIYGYNDIFKTDGQLKANAEETLLLYLGVMFGVSSAGSAIRVLSSKLAQNMAAKLSKQALTKKSYYIILRKVLLVFGTKLTKRSFARVVGKVIPIIGGFISFGINLAAMKPMANKLKEELSKGVEYSTYQMKKDIDVLDAEFKEVDGEALLEDLETNFDLLSDDQEATDDELRYLAEIERAYELYTNEIITEEEFEEIKRKCLEQRKLS